MAGTPSADAVPEVPSWLKSLPFAPEYHPTATEFQDPIAYILKIEKEASRYGICKIVPPLPPSSKKTVVANLNRCLAARGGDTSSTFTTRQQQIGYCPRKQRSVQKPVWQSGEHYTVEEFECKANSFERSYLRRGRRKSLSPLEIESLYWKSCAEKPFSVEYANDMPGSAFAGGGCGGRRRQRAAVVAESVGETAWNMQGVSRARGSLLRYMKEEIAGVTSPMVYIGMLFSWFAWHVEDHDLHSLNYMHLGAGKTWYGVPKDAAVAFEEVIRVHGYGGEINPLVTFAILGEKTTVMSPEVFINAGIPCCRLVQNAGEFVVTFPRAYHSGFSHGFNCGEAANIATPEWLKFAKDAAIRRASISYPPMVSHVQLLYDLTLELFSSSRRGSEPRSSRLKDKKKGEGESVVKELFVHDVISKNDLLFSLSEGKHPVILLPRNSSPVTSPSRVRNRESFSPCFTTGFMDLFPGKGHFAAFCGRYRLPPFGKSDTMLLSNSNPDPKRNGSPDQGLSCVACGILSFPCYAIVRPRDAAAGYLMSADSSFLNDWVISSEVTSDGFIRQSTDATSLELSSSPGLQSKEKQVLEGLYDVPIQSGDFRMNVVADETHETALDDVVLEDESTALRLLALTYGDDSSGSDHDYPDPGSSFERGNSWPEVSGDTPYSRDETSGRRTGNLVGPTERVHVDPLSPDGSDPNDRAGSEEVLENPKRLSTPPHNGGGCLGQPPAPPLFESSKTHVFCLEHAVEVQQQLLPIGGAHILLVCYPEYPEMEGDARVLAGEMSIEHAWNVIEFKEASGDEEALLRVAGVLPEGFPGNGDWAVKLGLNLCYSAGLSRSPLYSKQMPYNPVIYKAFGHPSLSATPLMGPATRPSVAGRWCGRVWMSNQVHPMLSDRDPEEGLVEPAGRKEKRRKTVVEFSAAPRRRAGEGAVGPATKGRKKEGHECEVEGCKMRFGTRHELVLHGRNICPEKGCGKKFFSHKYLVQHRRVHLDERPLKCPWRGCKMTFKWAWARTEHIRVHTGDRPYVCGEPGCDQTFRFVSDFSRHKRKTGHSTKKKARTG